MKTFGQEIYTRSISALCKTDKHGNSWQYHPRSDAHSKIACWAIVFDVLLNCPLLRDHAKRDTVGFGINRKMHDFRMNRDKDLDLVIAANPNFVAANDLKGLASSIGVRLIPSEESELASLPVFKLSDAGSVLVALEAKACMTEHLKARPRLYDELSSSYQTIHGDTESAIAAGFVTINVAESFISPLRNNPPQTATFEKTIHRQPDVARKVLDKVRELPRRAKEKDQGYDAVGVTLIRCLNDGSDIDLADEFSDGTKIDAILTYRSMIDRISSIYATRFSHI